jgi:hypothetical protein
LTHPKAKQQPPPETFALLEKLWPSDHELKPLNSHKT